MRGLSLAMAVVLVWTAGACWAGGFEATGKTDGYTVRVVFDKDHPTQGPNQAEILITDGASRPVSNAQVNIEYLMPSLPGKPPMMYYTTSAKPVKERYVATLDLSMKGEWKVVVSIVTMTDTKRTEQMAFGFEVR